MSYVGEREHGVVQATRIGTIHVYIIRYGNTNSKETYVRELSYMILY